MAQGNSWKGTFVAMLAGGVVGVFLAPILAPAIARVGKPAAKAAIKAGMAIYQRGREATAELLETFEDITAEVEAETATEQSASTTAQPTPRKVAGAARSAVH
jgi:hypothetical protein